MCGNCADLRVQLRTPGDRPTRVKEWWFKYIKMASEHLQSSQYTADELNPSVHAALDVAAGCSRCRDMAKEALQTFTPLLLDRVREIVTKVCASITYA